jgi:hypothetical protein
MWEDTHYCFVVMCKNFWFHVRQNLFYGHRIPLGETDVYGHPPDIKVSFKVRCDSCQKEYLYEQSDVMKFEQELPETFSPHPLFQLSGLGETGEMLAQDATEQGNRVATRHTRR